MNEEITTKQWVLNIIVAIAIVGGIGFAIYQTVKVPEDDSAFRNEYLAGCMGESASFSFCNCTFDVLKDNVGMDGLLKLSAEYDGGDVLPKEAYTAIAKCADKY